MRTQHEYDITLEPVPWELDHPANIWEHPPLDYYQFGEYPRFHRNVGYNQPQTRQVRTIKKDCRCIECSMKRAGYKVL